jgi:hypothetical protein
MRSVVVQLILVVVLTGGVYGKLVEANFGIPIHYVSKCSMPCSGGKCYSTSKYLPTAHPGICLPLDGGVFDGTLSNGRVSGNPCNRQSRDVSVSADVKPPGEQKSMQSPPASVPASTGKSGEGSTPLIYIWNAHGVEQQF